MLRVIGGTAVDGPGLRTAVYCAGCHNHCPGCHNPQSWDIAQGQMTSTDELVERILAEECDGVTFTGGDPMEQSAGFAELARKLRQHGIKDIWCYTGRIYEDLCDLPETLELLKQVDVLVDGPYVAAERNEELLFRGSANQRLVDVRRSLKAGEAVLVNEKKLLLAEV